MSGQVIGPAPLAAVVVTGTSVSFSAVMPGSGILVSAIPILKLQEMFCWIIAAPTSTQIGQYPLYLQLYNQAALPVVNPPVPAYEFPILGVESPISWGAVNIVGKFGIGLVAALSLEPSVFTASFLTARIAFNYET